MGESTWAKRRRMRERRLDGDGAAERSYARGCGGKASFPSKARARARAEKINARDDDAGLSAYKCRYCGRWHLTSRRSEGSASRARKT